MYDHEKREQQVNQFLNNKIKRCVKCRNELDYLEKFHFSDRICSKCQRIKPLIEQYEESAPLKANCLPPLAERIHELQQMNKMAEKKWLEEHATAAQFTPSSKIEVVVNEAFDSERIFDLIRDYDEGKPMNISQENLMSLLWEVLRHRKITSKY